VGVDRLHVWMWTCYSLGRIDEKPLPESNRAVARDAGLADFANVAMGSAAPVGTPEMDCRRLESFGEQATRARLPADRGGEEAVTVGALAVGTALRGHCRHSESGEREPGMRFPFWRRSRQEDLGEEIESHLRMAAREREERGETSRA